MKLVYLTFPLLLAFSVEASTKVALEGFVKKRGPVFILDVEAPSNEAGKYQFDPSPQVAKYENVFVKTSGAVRNCGKTKCLAVTTITPAVYDPLVSKNLKSSDQRKKKK